MQGMRFSLFLFILLDKRSHQSQGIDVDLIFDLIWYHTLFAILVDSFFIVRVELHQVIMIVIENTMRLYLPEPVIPNTSITTVSKKASLVFMC